MMTANTPWFTRIGPARMTPSVRLVCFPYAGGGPSAFMRWRDWMPDEVEILALHLPGREARIKERPSFSFASTIENIVTAIRLLAPLPTVYFGHSLGGLVAFEVAQRLEREVEGAFLLHLFVSGCSPPHIIQEDKDDPAWRLEDARFIERLRDLNGTPQEVLDSQELMELFIPMLRADFRLADEARTCIGGQTGVPTTVLGGLDDKSTPMELAEWQRYAAAPVRIHMFPGDHFFVNTAREAVCGAVSAQIANLLATRGHKYATSLQVRRT